MTDLRCTVCGRSMWDESTQLSAIGMQISVSGFQSAGQFAGAFQRIYPELSFPLDVAVCYACLLKSFGVPVEAK